MTFFNIHIGMDLICALLSMVGSYFVSRYDRWSYLGWSCWIVANVAWIVWGISGKDEPVIGVILMNTFFLATSVRGLRKTMQPAQPPGVKALPNSTLAQ